MRPQLFLLRKTSWQLAFFLVTVLSLFVISSCKDGKKKPTTIQAVKTTGIDASCFELARTTIETEWVNPGYISKINYIVFYTYWDPLTMNFTVRAMGYDVSNNSVGSPINLTKGASCNIKLPALAIGENIITLADLNILNGTGGLKTFDYVLLTPEKFVPAPAPGPTPPGDYLSYDVSVVGGSDPPIMRPALPCPPCQYCRPPNCDTVIIDDTALNPVLDTAARRTQ